MHVETGTRCCEMFVEYVHHWVPVERERDCERPHLELHLLGISRIAHIVPGTAQLPLIPRDVIAQI